MFSVSTEPSRSRNSATSSKGYCCGCDQIVAVETRGYPGEFLTAPNVSICHATGNVSQLSALAHLYRRTIAGFLSEGSQRRFRISDVTERKMRRERRGNLQSMMSFIEKLRSVCDVAPVSTRTA